MKPGKPADALMRDQLQGSRWLLLKKPDELSDSEPEHLEAILQAVPELARHYTLQEDFRGMDAVRDSQKAAQRLEEWLEEASTHGHAAVHTFVITVKNWRDEILSFCATRGSTAFAAGVNNKIKLVLRRAFGCSNFAHLRLRIIVAFDSSSYKIRESH